MSGVESKPARPRPRLFRVTLNSSYHKTWCDVKNKTSTLQDARGRPVCLGCYTRSTCMQARSDVVTRAVDIWRVARRQCAHAPPTRTAEIVLRSDAPRLGYQRRAGVHPHRLR